jgi:coenzyme PQQ precursor peptide PqqA
LALALSQATPKPLISRCFEPDRRPVARIFFCVATYATQDLWQKISLANFSARITLVAGRKSSGSKKECQMAWRAPKIVEVPVGMEINMYACAARK